MKPYIPQEPKYLYQTKTVYKVEWPKQFVYDNITHDFINDGALLNGTPCATYRNKGYGRYYSELTLDLEGNVYPRNTDDNSI